MSEPKPREWLFYIDDMIGFVEKAIAYTKELDQERIAMDTGLTVRPGVTRPYAQDQGITKP